METKIIGYCVKCKTKREIKNPEIVEIRSKGGSARRACKGICPICNTKMFRFMPKEKIPSEDIEMSGEKAERIKAETANEEEEPTETSSIKKEVEDFDEDN